MPGSEVQELGRLLRETRESKGATLADAQQATKIRQSFLQALESENYAVLPPPFYIRGFIKTYSIFLGLDPRSTVQIFDELLENESTARITDVYTTPSADSGGSHPRIPLNGLSQGEARLVEASNEKLNLAALPAPTLPGHLGPNAGQGSADSSGESRSLVPVSQRNLLLPDQKYVLKPVMLPTTKGAFYMPNFAPTILVIIIVVAACLLVYRGISSAKDAENAAIAATATANASNTVTQSDGTAGISSALTPNPTNDSATGLPVSGSASTSAVLSPPPFYTPDAAIAALDKNVATALAGQPAPAGGKPAQAAPAPTAPAPTPVPPTPTVVPSPTPLPNPITVEVTVGTADTKGSWLTITVDDQEKIARIAQPGEVLSFEGRKIAVRAGNPGVVSIKVNGESREYTKPQSGIITHTWFADGHDTVTQ